MRGILGEFKRFLLKGSLVDLAVAFVMGLAFNQLVQAFVTTLINPLVGLVIPGDSLVGWDFTVLGATFAVGEFLNQAIAFLATAAAVFFFVVKPYQTVQAQRARGEVPDEAAISDDERRHQELLTALRELKA
jgi:large conductance mechanosensitive channel